MLGAIMILMLFCSQIYASEATELPWLIRPVPKVNDGPIPTGFPIVTGLKPELLATIPDPQRQEATAVHLFFDQTQYAQITQLMKTDPAFASGWVRLFRAMRGMMADDGQGYLQDLNPEQYVYSVYWRLRVAALFYRMTGDPHAGAFLKAIALDTSQRPMSFWMHKALRKYTDDWPLGQLETSMIAQSMSAALVWGHDLYTDSERALIINALRDKGLYPMLRFLEITKYRNNWLPVIASGAMSAAVALDDSLAIEHSMAFLNKWGALIEDDGSYGEQIEYFNFGCSNFAKGHMVLGREHFLKIGKQMPQLHGALAWQLAHFSFNDKRQPIRLNFGDDDYAGRLPGRLAIQFLAHTTHNGLGTWMLNNFYGEQPREDAYGIIAKLMMGSVKLPEVVSPATLPTTMGYNTGMAITRSGWTMDQDTVLALRSGGATRTKYTHDHPNRNAIAMMFHGEYQLVEPGRASYRSKIHKTYDLRTPHHNTISFSGSNQTRDRVAELLVAAQYGDDLSVIVSEAAQSYKEKPKHVRRSVYYLRGMDLFVVWDVVQVEQPQTVEVNWHFGNNDFKSTLNAMSDEHWQLVKPRTQLDTFVFTDKTVTSLQRKGVMHQNFSYSPGDPGEGQWGNAFELQLSSSQTERHMSAVSVFAPQVREHALPVKVRYQNQTGIISLEISKGDQTAKVVLDALAIDKSGKVAATVNGLNLDAKGHVLGM